MGKNVLLSNGDMTVAINQNGTLESLRLPKNNNKNYLNTSKMSSYNIGIYINNVVHWLDSGLWSFQQSYYPGRLVCRTIATNHWLNIRLDIMDIIDQELNVLVRSFDLYNLSNKPCSLKLYIYQAFQINDDNSYDTVQYIPDGGIKDIAKPIIHHYGDSASLLIAAESLSGRDFTEFTVGKYGLNDDINYDGSWRDSTDGLLSYNEVDTGKTDSIISFDYSLAAYDSAHCHYFLAADSNLPEASRSLSRFLREGIASRIAKTSDFWYNWTQPIRDLFQNDSEERHLIDAVSRLHAQTTTSGAVFSKNNKQIASNPSVSALVASVYNSIGAEIEAIRIFSFFEKSLGKDSLLAPNYTMSGQINSNDRPWIKLRKKALPPIQIRDTAIMLLSLCQCIEVGLPNDLSVEWKKLWSNLGIRLANALVDSIDDSQGIVFPSYADNDFSAAVRTDDMIYVHQALSRAINLAEQTNNTNEAIKYSTAVDTLANNMIKFWNKDRQYFYHSLLIDDSSVDMNQSVELAPLLLAISSKIFPDNLLEQARTSYVGTFRQKDFDMNKYSFTSSKIPYSDLLAYATSRILWRHSSHTISIDQINTLISNSRQSNEAILDNKDLLLLSVYIDSHKPILEVQK